MKIIDWFKSLFSKVRKNDYMLEEGNNESKIKQDEKKNFIPRVDVSNIQHQKTREEVLRDLNRDIIIEDLSEEYNYGKFSTDNIREKYDLQSKLTDEDLTAISCLYGAIKDGNKEEHDFSDNKINKFLKENSNNIVVLVNLMIKDAKKLYESLDDDISKSTTVQGLIPGSYGDISTIIEEYTKENEIQEK